jgi:hypothetical protein
MEMNEFIDQINQDEAYFDPEANEMTMVPQGTYPAHITSLNVKEDVVVKGKWLADIYVPSFTIAKQSNDASGMKVNDSNYGQGIFRFKKPDPSTNLEDRAGAGNSGYKSLLEALGFSLEEKKAEDGRVLYKLPRLVEDKVIGLPVLIKVFHQKYLSAGEERVSVKASVESAWDEGQKVEVENDLPF